MKQQKQAARLERMRTGTYVTQHSIAKGAAGASNGHTKELLGARGAHTVRRFMRIRECGKYLLWGKSESDQKVIKVAIGGISCIEIGHKSSSWKSISLATPPTSPTPILGAGVSRSEGEAALAPLPPEWQCLAFVLKDMSKSTMLLSTDNDVDAALWCVVKPNL